MVGLGDFDFGFRFLGGVIVSGRFDNWIIIFSGVLVLEVVDSTICSG